MDERHRQAVMALSVMLHEAQGVRDVERNRDIDIGGEVVTVRTVLDEYRAALAAATERAEKLAGLLEYEVKAHNDTRRKLCSAEGGESLYKRMAEEAEARADALAARLAEVDDREHPQ